MSDIEKLRLIRIIRRKYALLCAYLCRRLNYTWDEKNLRASSAAAQKLRRSRFEVYAGIDCFGRGTLGGGGMHCNVALSAITEIGLSVALFACAWPYEKHICSQGRLAGAASATCAEERTVAKAGRWFENIFNKRSVKTKKCVWDEDRVVPMWYAYDEEFFARIKATWKYRRATVCCRPLVTGFSPGVGILSRNYNNEGTHERVDQHDNFGGLRCCVIRSSQSQELFRPSFQYNLSSQHLQPCLDCYRIQLANPREEHSASSFSIADFMREASEDGIHCSRIEYRPCATPLLQQPSVKLSWVASSSSQGGSSLRFFGSASDKAWCVRLYKTNILLNSDEDSRRLTVQCCTAAAPGTRMVFILGLAVDSDSTGNCSNPNMSDMNRSDVGMDERDMKHRHNEPYNFGLFLDVAADGVSHNADRRTRVSVTSRTAFFPTVTSWLKPAKARRWPTGTAPKEWIARKFVVDLDDVAGLRGRRCRLSAIDIHVSGGKGNGGFDVFLDALEIH